VHVLGVLAPVGSSAARAALDLTGAESVKANTREAPRGRRSISKAPQGPRQELSVRDAIPPCNPLVAPQ